MARYCVGTTMAIDWEEDGQIEVRVDRRSVQRALAYFLPYWRRGLLALAVIGAGAALGLVPALLAKKLIDHLTAADASFSYVVVLVAAGLRATLVAGLKRRAPSARGPSGDDRPVVRDDDGGAHLRGPRRSLVLRRVPRDPRRGLARNGGHARDRIARGGLYAELYERQFLSRERRAEKLAVV